MKTIPDLAGGLFLLLALLPGCASVRSATRDLQNVDRVGEQAPRLEGGVWVLPGGFDAADVELAEWKLLVVFNPD